MTETELVARLDKLERDNRRLKRLSGSALVLVAALGAICAASYSPTGRRSGTQGVLDKITAREFDLLDSSGRVRVKIAMDCSIPKDCWPGIDLMDQSGTVLTGIGAGTLEIMGKKGNTTLLASGIQVEGKSSGGRLGDIANLGVGLFSEGASLALSGPNGLSVELEGQSAVPGGEGGVLSLTGKNDNSIYIDSNSPLIEIAEGKGSLMDLGSTRLVAPRTGATEQTSAASIVMFDGDEKHHVIWKTP